MEKVSKPVEITFMFNFITFLDISELELIVLFGTVSCRNSKYNQGFVLFSKMFKLRHIVVEKNVMVNVHVPTT